MGATDLRRLLDLEQLDVAVVTRLIQVAPDTGDTTRETSTGGSTNQLDVAVVTRLIQVASDARDSTSKTSSGGNTN